MSYYSVYSIFPILWVAGTVWVAVAACGKALLVYCVVLVGLIVWLGSMIAGATPGGGAAGLFVGIMLLGPGVLVALFRGLYLLRRGY